MNTIYCLLCFVLPVLAFNQTNFVNIQNSTDLKPINQTNFVNIKNSTDLKPLYNNCVEIRDYYYYEEDYENCTISHEDKKIYCINRTIDICDEWKTKKITPGPPLIKPTPGPPYIKLPPLVIDYLTEAIICIGGLFIIIIIALLIYLKREFTKMRNQKRNERLKNREQGGIPLLNI